MSKVLKALLIELWKYARTIPKRIRYRNILFKRWVKPPHKLRTMPAIKPLYRPNTPAYKAYHKGLGK